MKTIFIACGLAILTLTVEAQVKIGLRVAPQLTWGTSDNKNTSCNGSRLNVAYGMMLDYYFTESYGIGTELCLNTYGVNVNLSKDKYSKVNFLHDSKTITNTDDVNFNYKLQYFQVPVLLKLRSKEIGAFRYYAEFGFGAAFLFRAKADISFPGHPLNEVNVNNPDVEDKYTMEPTNFSNEVNTVWATMIIGAGVHYSLNKNSMLVLGLRYDNGMTSFLDDEKLSTSLNYMALNLGLLF